MSSVNKVTILGNLGRDPDVRHTQDGGMVTNLAIATTETWNDKYTGDRREKTEWHRVVCFRKTAEIASQYLNKGSQVYIEGSLQRRSYDDNNTRAKRYITEIVAQRLVLIGGRASNSNNGGSNAQPQRRQQYNPQQQGQPQQRQPAMTQTQPEDIDDDIPF